MTTAKEKGARCARERLFIAAACLFTVIIALFSAALYRPYLARLDGVFLDATLPKNDAPPADYAGPVVVAIDDESLARYGRWPWPRTLTARLFAAVAAQKPASIGIDALFPEPEASGGQERGAGGSALSPGDRELARTFCAAPFVVGYEFTFPPKRAPVDIFDRLHPLPLLTVHGPLAEDPRQHLWQANGAIGSLSEFTRCITGSGFVNASFDDDGTLRRMPILITGEGKVYPSLALATLLRGYGVGRPVLSSSWYGGRVLQLGARRIPLDEQGRLLLRYHDWYSALRPISAAALLDGRLPPQALAGRLVFIGATGTGMGETVATPLNGTVCGVQVHAITAENMLRQDVVRTAPRLYRLLFLLALSAIAMLLSLYCGTALGAAVVAGTAFAAWQGALALAGRSGVILSPVLPELVMVVNFSVLSLLRLVLAEEGAQRQKRELKRARDLMMTSLAALTEIRDTETGAHIRRTQLYLHMLCRELATYPRFRQHLDAETIELIAKLAPLHDIGKVGLPDHLLRKSSGFSRDEYEEVKKHTVYGRDAIAKAAARVGAGDDELVHYAIDLTYAHHERWDGSGYPEKLKGEEIPWAGRIMALVDTYDAMVTQRVYNKPVSHEEAVRVISEGRGKLFDPDVVDGFLNIEEEWRKVARQVAEEGLD